MWFVIRENEIPGIVECYLAESVRPGLKPCHDAYPLTYRLDWNLGPSLAFDQRHMNNSRRQNYLYSRFYSRNGSHRFIKRAQTPKRRRTDAFLRSFMSRLVVS